VLIDIKALRFASTPLRGADGLDVASARAAELSWRPRKRTTIRCGRLLFRIPRFRTTVDKLNVVVALAYLEEWFQLRKRALDSD
jgi:hypothetical protein